MVVLRSCKLSNHSLLSSYHPICRVLINASFSSTNPQTASIQNQVTLCKRISPAAVNPKISIVPILDQWVEEGNAVSVDELKNMIKFLRNHNRYSHALQLSEWMTNRSYLEQSPGNVAVHLDLVSRVHRLNQAEKFFNSIPDSLKNFQVYGTLLNCYTFTKSIEKAEATIQKMKQLGCLSTHSYNSMLNLYSKTGNHEKLSTLIQEMEKTGVRYYRSTYYIQLTAYASFDVKAMEKLLKNIEANPHLPLDWHVYIIASKGYLKFGQMKKSWEMLKKSEKHIFQNTTGVAYEILLTMYASLSKKDDVYRIWDIYKKTWRKVNDKGYHHMISSLVKLGDIDGAEKILAEWESVNPSFDFLVPNVLINAYSKTGHWKKAETYVDRVVGTGKQPPASTWDILATAYRKHNEMEKAVNAMRKAIIAYNGVWELNQVTLRACLKYLEKKGDSDMAKEFVRVIGCQGDVLAMRNL